MKDKKQEFGNKTFKRMRRFSQISARGAVEQRPKHRYARFQLIIQQTRPTTTNGSWVHRFVEIVIFPRNVPTYIPATCTYARAATINSLKKRGGGGGAEGGHSSAPWSMVPSTMISILGSIPGLRHFFLLFHPTFFHRSTISDRLRFELRAHGLRRLLIIFLHLVGGRRVPNGIASGWDQVPMGSGEPSRVLFCFPAVLENIPRNSCFHHMETSTDKWLRVHTLVDYARHALSSAVQ